jgi:formylglycine-generating enzyme required for sulfatase activity
MVPPAFASIPDGWFTMGTLRGHEDERPPHPVFIDRFELGVCPVTRAEYACLLDATGTSFPANGRIRPLPTRICPSWA